MNAPRRAPFGHDGIEAAFAASEPLVLTGVPLGDAWSQDELAKALHDTVFEVSIWEDRFRRPKESWSIMASKSRMSFGRFAELSRSGEAARRSIYLSQVPVDGTALASAPPVATLKGLVPARASGRVLFWAATAGQVTSLHFDDVDNLLFLLSGTKRVLLFPPEASDGLYPFPPSSGVGRHMSRLYPRAPDHLRFPGYRAVQHLGLDFLLQPGEVLCLPAGWWHEVISEGDELTLAMNLFLDSALAARGPAAAIPALTDEEMTVSQMVRAAPGAVRAALTDEASIRAWWNAGFRMASPGIAEAELCALSQRTFLTIEVDVTDDRVTWRFQTRGGIFASWQGSKLVMTITRISESWCVVTFFHTDLGEQAGPRIRVQTRALWQHFLGSLVQHLAGEDAQPFGG